MKSYTDINQSKKLAEILPIESADMYWFKNNTETPKIFPKNMMKDSVYVTLPCWSLAALLDILPKIHGLKPIIDLEENSIQYNGIDLYVVKENLVDACIEMIIKLKEKDLL